MLKYCIYYLHTLNQIDIDEKLLYGLKDFDLSNLTTSRTLAYTEIKLAAKQSIFLNVQKQPKNPDHRSSMFMVRIVRKAKYH